MTIPRNILLLYAARGVRGFGDGFATITLPAYLIAIGYDPVRIGLVVAASLLGTAVLTLAIGAIASRHDLRTLMLLGALLMTLTGLAFPNFRHIAAIMFIGFVGSINPSSGDLGVLVPLEQAMLAGNVSNEERTRAFARYSLTGALLTALGTLAAASPDFLQRAGFGALAALSVMFYAYAGLGLVCALLYWLLPHVHMAQTTPAAPLGPSRGIVYKLSALFSLDAFAGGFIVQSLLALWLFERFNLSLSAASVFFFWSSLLSALSFPVAAWLSRRVRAGQHHGVHPRALEPVFDPGGFLVEPRSHARAVVAPLGAVADGCADAHLLHHGGGDARRTRGGRERDRRAAQPRLRHKSDFRRHAVRKPVLRLTAPHLRQSEARLRRGALVFLPPSQSAGGSQARRA